MSGNYTEITERGNITEGGYTRSEDTLRGIYVVRGIHGMSFTLKRKKGHTQRGDTEEVQRGDTLVVGIYTENGLHEKEGGHIKRGHSVKTLWKKQFLHQIRGVGWEKLNIKDAIIY